MRADGWARLPLIRMTNVSLLPGEQTLEEVFGGVSHAIYMETNRSWSIDDKRYNFQFGCEIGWEIRDGKRVRMLKNPSYSGITTEFWNACAAIAGPRALDAVGRAQLRQGPARAGDGHRPRRQPGALPQHQGRERVCADEGTVLLTMEQCRRAFEQVQRAARVVGRRRRRSDRSARIAPRSRASPTTPSIRTWPSRRTWLSVRAGDRRAHGARHHQPAGRRVASATVVEEAIALTRSAAARSRAAAAGRARAASDDVAALRRGHRRGHARGSRAGRGRGHPRWSRTQGRPPPESIPPARAVDALLNSRGVAAWHRETHGAVFHHRHGGGQLRLGQGQRLRPWRPRSGGAGATRRATKPRLSRRSARDCRPAATR